MYSTGIYATKGLTSTALVASDFESTSATAIMKNNTKRGKCPQLDKMWNSTESYIKILPVIDGESIQYFFNGTIVCAMEMMILTDATPNVYWMWLGGRLLNGVKSWVLTHYL